MLPKVCFEDFDRCFTLRIKDFLRFFNTETDGVVETPKHITMFTESDFSVLQYVPA